MYVGKDIWKGGEDCGGLNACIEVKGSTMEGRKKRIKRATGKETHEKGGGHGKSGSDHVGTRFLFSMLA